MNTIHLNLNVDKNFKNVKSQILRYAENHPCISQYQFFFNMSQHRSDDLFWNEPIVKEFLL